MQGKKKNTPPEAQIAFVVCHRRKNRPQIAPQVCRERCRYSQRCPDFYDYIQPAMFARYDRKTRRQTD